MGKQKKRGEAERLYRQALDVEVASYENSAVLKDKAGVAGGGTDKKTRVLKVIVDNLVKLLLSQDKPQEARELVEQYKGVLDNEIAAGSIVTGGKRIFLLKQ